TIFDTCYGQNLDNSSKKATKDLFNDYFTLKKYNEIAIYKTSIYSVVCPVKLAILLNYGNLAEFTSSTEYQLKRIGLLFQIKDDLLDIAQPKNILESQKKSNTDIAEKKCTWLINSAMYNASPREKKQLIVFLAINFTS
ncbi:MAG: hypothetical protein MHPSP_004693, partial [Paramarteilia canceri]